MMARPDGNAKRSIGDMEIAITYHDTFYAIAHKHYKRMLPIVKDRDSKPIKTDNDVDDVVLKNAEIQRQAMVVAIFSALTLEAFINDYGIYRFSSAFFDDHLDKLGPSSKWLIIPRLVTGKEIPRDGQAHKGIVKVFDLRNRLVHYKARKKKISDLKDDKDWVTEKHADAAYKSVDLAVLALKAIDPSVDVDWLEEAKTDPFV